MKKWSVKEDAILVREILIGTSNDEIFNDVLERISLKLKVSSKECSQRWDKLKPRYIEEYNLAMNGQFHQIKEKIREKYAPIMEELEKIHDSLSKVEESLCQDEEVTLESSLETEIHHLTDEEKELVGIFIQLIKDGKSIELKKMLEVLVGFQK